MESIRPGTFQENINEMFRLNKLPLVKFPSNIFSEGIKELYKETLETQFNASTNQSQQQTHETEQDKETETQLVEENMETDSNKRQRESIEPPSLGNKEKKQKERDEQPEKVWEHTDQSMQYVLPPPIQVGVHTQPRSRPPSPAPRSVGEGEVGGMGLSVRSKMDLNPKEKKRYLKNKTK